MQHIVITRDYVGTKAAHMGGHPLRSAAERGAAHEIRRLLAAGHDPNHRDRWGVTALVEAAGGCQLDALTALLDDPRTDVTQGLLDVVRDGSGARTPALALILERLPDGAAADSALQEAADFAHRAARWWDSSPHGPRHRAAADLLDAEWARRDRAVLEAVAADGANRTRSQRRM